MGENDVFWAQGGSYIINSAGQKALVERTLAVEEIATPITAPIVSDIPVEE
jgi:hypothetical protein